MRATILLILALLVAAAGTAVAEDKVYGEGVGEGDLTSISAIMTDADAFQGETVRIAGTAVAVCAHRGCWIDIASDEEGQTLRVKVTDGEIVFPQSIVGEHVVAEGVFTANRVTADNKKCDHAAEDENEVGHSCTTHYQLTGTGAVVRAS